MRCFTSTGIHALAESRLRREASARKANFSSFVLGHLSKTQDLCKGLLQ